MPATSHRDRVAPVPMGEWLGTVRQPDKRSTTVHTAVATSNDRLTVENTTLIIRNDFMPSSDRPQKNTKILLSRRPSRKKSRAAHSSRCLHAFPPRVCHPAIGGAASRKIHARVFAWVGPRVCLLKMPALARCCASSKSEKAAHLIKEKKNAFAATVAALSPHPSPPPCQC